MGPAPFREWLTAYRLPLLLTKRVEGRGKNEECYSRRMGSPGKASIEPAGYYAYIKSPAWAEVRRKFWSSGRSKACYICGGYKRPMHLHHRTYKNLGNEGPMDLVPVHPKCHKLIHALHDARVNPNQSLWASTKKAKERYGPKKPPPKPKARKKPAARRKRRR